MTKSDVTSLVVIAVALCGLGYLFFLSEPASELAYAPVEVTGSSMTVQAGPNLTYADVSGTVVKGGFVTIHESIGPAPGPIVGTSRYYEPGQLVDASINVTPAFTPGLTYIALLHVDDGDGVFEAREDMPVMSDGQVVRWDFIAEPAE